MDCNRPPRRLTADQTSVTNSRPFPGLGSKRTSRQGNTEIMSNRNIGTTHKTSSCCSSKSNPTSQPTSSRCAPKPDAVRHGSTSRITNHSAPQNDFTLLMVGGACNGKSATGNSILGKQAFKINTNASFQTKSEPVIHSGFVNGKQVSVIDGLNIDQNNCGDYSNIAEDICALTQAYQLSRCGFSAVLIILKFGVAYSREEGYMLNNLKTILGENVIEDFGICIVTYGDNFCESLKNDENDFTNFEQWCSKQSRNLRNLFIECDSRIVLFNNKTKDEKEKEEQMSKLYRLLEKLPQYGIRSFAHNRPNKNEFSFSREENSFINEGTRLILDNFGGRLEATNNKKDYEMVPILESMMNGLSKYYTIINHHPNYDVMKCSSRITDFYTEIQNRLKIRSLHYANHEYKDTLRTERVPCENNSRQLSHVPGYMQNPHNSSALASEWKTPLNIPMHDRVASFDEEHVKKIRTSSIVVTEQPNDVNLGLSDDRDDQIISDDDMFPDGRQPPQGVLFLVGGWGTGKGSTGNSIIGKPEFHVSSSTSGASSMSKPSVVSESSLVPGQEVSVVDIPGGAFDGRGMEVMLKRLLKFCGNSFSAVLIVLKYGSRFTERENEMVHIIKKIFGNNVIRDFGICVVTHGDHFQHSVDEAKEDGRVLIFDDWCREQAGDFRSLFQECSYRCVLFNNKTKDETAKHEQRQTLLKMVDFKKKYSKD